MVQGDVISYRVGLYRDQHATIVKALSLANNVADLPDVGERAVRRWLSLNTTCSTPKIRLQHHQGSQSALVMLLVHYLRFSRRLGSCHTLNLTRPFLSHHILGAFETENIVLVFDSSAF